MKPVPLFSEPFPEPWKLTGCNNTFFFKKLMARRSQKRKHTPEKRTSSATGKIPAEIWQEIGRFTDAAQDLLAAHLTCRLMRQSFPSGPDWLLARHKWRLLIKNYSGWEPFRNQVLALIDGDRDGDKRDQEIQEIVRHAISQRRGEFLRFILDRILNIDATYLEGLREQIVYRYDQTVDEWEIAADRELEDRQSDKLATNLFLVGPDDAAEAKLYEASVRGHVDRVDHLLRNRKSKVDTNERLALVMACEWGQLAVVERLLQDRRFDLSASDPKPPYYNANSSGTALQVACHWGHTAVVDRLLRDGRADPTVGKKTNKPIPVAVGDGPQYLDEVEWTPLSMACRKGHLDTVVRLLQDPRVDPAAQENEALNITKDLTIVEVLLADPRVDPAAYGQRAIYSAVMNGHLKIVERLLRDARVDPSTDDNRCIRVASGYGHVEIISRLLEDTRVDPTARDNACIRRASEYHHLGAVQRLLQDSRVDPAVNDNECVINAARSPQWNVYDWNYPDEPDRVPVRHTQQWQLVDSLLRDPRVDPSARDSMALCVACEGNNWLVVDLLLQDERVDPAAQDYRAVINAVEVVDDDDAEDPTVLDGLLLHPTDQCIIAIAKDRAKENRKVAARLKSMTVPARKKRQRKADQPKPTTAKRRQ